MASSELTPDRLRTFLAVARRENFTQAAQEVHLTQSAVSRQIAILERSLGVGLFDRIGKVARLTEAGRTLLPEFRRILGDLARVEEAVRNIAAGKAGRLRIGASATPGYYIVPAVLARFRQLHPAVELEFTVGNTARVEELLVENTVDIGLVGGKIDEPNLLVEPFAEDQIVCFAARHHPLARRKQLRARDLSDETLVLREEGSATRSAFLAWFHTAGGRVRRSIELGCPEAVKAVVATGLGIGCLSRFGLRDELCKQRFVILRTSSEAMSRTLSMVRHRQKSVSPGMDEFVALLKGATGLKGRVTK